MVAFKDHRLPMHLWQDVEQILTPGIFAGDVTLFSK